MSEDNTVAQVASGTAPQPNAKVETNYQALQQEVEDAIGGPDGEDYDDSDLTDDVTEAAPVQKTITQEKVIDAAQAKGDITKAQAQQLKKTLKIKVDGKETEETVDFNDEEGLKRYVQKAKAFDKRNNEFTQYKSQMDELLKMLETDPESLMEKLGHNLDDFAERRLTKKVEELKKSPEQIEREKMEKELSQLRDEKKRADQERQNLEMEKMRNESAQQIETEISEALSTTNSMLPQKNPIVLQRIAQTMIAAMNNGYPQVTAKDVIPLVEKQWQQELNEFFSVLPEETLERLVGKGNIDRVRKKAVAAKRAVAQGQTATAKQIVKDTGAPKQVVDDSAKTKKKFRNFFTLD